MSISLTCSERAVGRVITIEGMPGAGKTTAANHLTAIGHTVVGEYTSDSGSPTRLDEHPAVDDDTAHQANWLRKHRAATDHRSAGATVFLDRDWLSSLAYAHSIRDDELLARRADWALGHLRAGALALPSAYVVVHIDPDESLRRRAHQLRPNHPWSRRNPLRRLAAFYRAPATALANVDTEISCRLDAATWTHVQAPTRQQLAHVLEELV